MNDRKQLVITHIKNKPVLIYMIGDKLYDILVGEENEKDYVSVGDIYVGRVQNIVQNIGAAFVEVKKEVLCYLPLSECQQLKCGDELVVQVKKAAVKTKQAVVTKFPEIVGRYAVISTKNSTKGISKKIESEEKKRQLQELLREFEHETYGIVLRTNAEEATEKEILTECRLLLDEMRGLMTYSANRTCFSLLRKEDNFYLKNINNYRPEEYDRIITDDRSVYEELIPVFGENVEFYEDASYSLDHLLGISHKIKKALEKRVWLKSGGNLVIEPTEALTVIDVNTGKAIEGKRKKETTFFKINCEAAVEAARQLRVRGISGIILIDFIDMQEKEHRRQLMSLLKEELNKDKVRTSLIDITKLGLVEITRMKKYKPLREMMDSEMF